MFYTIYKITNKVNGKIYIGKHQTKDLNDGYMGSGKHLKRAIEKYGIENFEKNILFVYDNEEEMNVKESELVTEDFVTKDNNYNLCPGGNGGFGYINSNNLRNGFEHRPEINKELNQRSVKRIKKLHETDSVWKENCRKATTQGLIKYFKNNPGHFTGKTHSEATKEKMRKPKNKGEKNSQYGTMWITNGTENKKIKKDVDAIPEGWHKGRTTS